jgi:hypothetical protein
VTIRKILVWEKAEKVFLANGEENYSLGSCLIGITRVKGKLSAGNHLLDMV